MSELATESENDVVLSTAERVVSIARGWIGTPYHHQASVKGVGCDCLGLVRGVYAEVYGQVPETPPPYTRDLAEASQTETLLEAAGRHFDMIHPWQVPQAGDVAVFRIRSRAMAKHCGILTTPDADRFPTRMIHAFEGAPVCEVSMSRWWWRHVAEIFRFPEEPK